MQVAEVKTESSGANAEPARTGERRVRTSRELALYVIRGVGSYSLVAFIVLGTVMGVIGTVRATEKFDVDFLLILPVLARAIGQAMIYTLPVSLLFGTSLLVGKLRADRELISCYSFGISPTKLAVPVIILGLVLSAISYPINNYLVPEFRYQNRNIATLIMDQLPYLGEGWGLEFSQDSYEIWVERHVGGHLEGIFLAIKGERGEGPISKSVLEDVETPTYPVYLFAERGRVGVRDGSDRAYRIQLEGVSVFVDGEFFDRGSPSDFVQRGYLASWTWEIPAADKSHGTKDLVGPALAAFRVEMYEQWKRFEARGDADTKRARRKYYSIVREQHRRITIALSCLTFPLAAFAIGIFLTSGNRLLPFFVASTVVPGLFFGLELFGGGLAQRGIVPALTEQLGNLALVALALVLFALETRGPRR